MPEKLLTLIFYGENGHAAKALASKLRGEGKSAQLRQTLAYGGEVEPCDAVVVMADVSVFDRARIDVAYGDKVQRAATSAEKPKLTLPPAPAPAIEPPPAPTPKGK